MVIPYSSIGSSACSLADKCSQSLFCLLVLSGIFGAIMGVSTATWQHPVETAQVLMGLVLYDHASLPYAYHVSLFSLLNYVAWFFLAVTNSEVSSSILLSALVGIMAMQTVAMVSFLILRNVYLAILITFFISATHFIGPGISYPIIFLGTEHTYGRAGLLFALYPILLLAFSKYRTGFFLCGLAIGIHPAWGLWLNACLALVLSAQFMKFKWLLNKKNVAFYLVGLSLPLIIFAWQKVHYPIAFDNTLVDAESARNIFLNYIRYWDYHRQKFDNQTMLEHGFLYALVTLCLTVFLRHFNKKDGTDGEVLFFSFVIASTLLSWPFVFIPSWFDPSNFPAFFVTLMPSRFINISIFLCTPVLLSALYSYRKRLALTHYIVAMLILFVVARSQYGNRYAAVLVVCLAGIIWIGQYVHKLSVFNPNIYLQIKTWLSFVTIFLVFLSPVYLIYKLHLVKKNNFQQVEIPSNIKGSILTTMERYMIQAETRVSSLPPHIDGYSYLGKAPILLALNQYTSDIYGISLATPPSPNLSLHGSVISTKDYKNLWESRSCEEWEALAIRYHFELILVPADMQLQLQKVDNDPKWNKYSPVCTSL